LKYPAAQSLGITYIGY